MSAPKPDLDRHPEAVKQAAVADRLPPTKPDLADGARRAALNARQRALNPTAPRSNRACAPSTKASPMPHPRRLSKETSP